MPLQKQTTNISFAQGLDTKTDPWQVQPGKMLELENAIFEKQGLLKKRNGFKAIRSLPDSNCDTITTYKNGLIAFGRKFYGLDPNETAWTDFGTLKSINLKTFPIVRRATSQTNQNTVVSENGIACTVWADSTGNCYYQLSDINTGHIIVSQTKLASGAQNPNVIATSKNFVITYTINTGTNDLAAIRVPFGSPYTASAPITLANTLFSLSDPYAVIKSEVFSEYTVLCYHVVGGGIVIAQYNAALSQVTLNTVASESTLHFLSLASYKQNNGTASSSYISIAFLSTRTYYDDIYFYLLDSNLNVIGLNRPVRTIAGAIDYKNLSHSVLNNRADIFYTTLTPLYGGFGSTLGNQKKVPTVNKATVTWTSSYTFSSTTSIVKPSVGLASQIFSYNSVNYFLGAYDIYNDSDLSSASQQPTLFLFNELGEATAKLAPQNSAWSMTTTSLPKVTANGSLFYLGYLYKTLITGFRNDPDSTVSSTTNGGFYCQTGINLVEFNLKPKSLDTSEIANNLHLSGGIVKAFDGANLVEQNFNLFPEQCAVISNNLTCGISNASPGVVTIAAGTPIVFKANDPIRFTTTGTLPAPLSTGTTYYIKTILTTSPALTFTVSSSVGGTAINTTTAGSGTHTVYHYLGSDGLKTADGPYFYQVTYEYMDAQGNIHRSAPSPSFPVGGFTPAIDHSSATVFIPKLWVTDKTNSNLVRVVIYRWSQSEQIFHNVIINTSDDPLLNTLTDYTGYVYARDALSSAQVIGHPVLYTTGGVLDNSAPPAANAIALFKNRLWLVDAEDQNLLWYSKPVLEGVPVEFSATQTLYVSPSLVVNDSGSTITAIAALDDKLIIFKKESIYYLTGIGPDITGQNNDFNDPTYVTSTIGCINTKSIVLTPDGLIFESDKGRWLLGRDLSTSYIGAPVEAFNQATTLSSLTVPGTNQVRFTLNNGISLMFDYYFKQWGTFTGIPNIGSTIYNGYHTYIDSSGNAYRETPGYFMDGTRPVVMKFTTAWFNLAGLQGFERAYYAYLLAQYISPHILKVSISYDYNPGSTQNITIRPTNFTLPYGTDALYGLPNLYGGNPTLEQFRIFFSRQKCQSFQISIQEQFDPSYNTTPGAGFTMSGLNLTIGLKLGHPKLPASQSVG